MEMDLENKIALVTGSGSGIGKAIALGLAREGVDIAVNDVVLSKAEHTANEVATMGRCSTAIQADVANEAEVQKMVARIVTEWGGIDILVNNAGIGGKLLLEDMEKAEWDRTMAVNLGGAFNCCKAVIPSMKQRGGGRIINIASYSGSRMTMISGVDYTASKAGILGLTRQLSYELGPFKITVNAISPGNTLTPRLEDRTTPKSLEEMRKWHPQGELQQPEDIADTAVFLASGRAKMINGTNIEVDGGITVPVAIGVDWEAYTSVKKEAARKKM